MIEQKIEQLKQQNQAIFQSAQKADWQQVNLLTADRQNFIASIFEQSTQPIIKDDIELIQQEVISFDAEILDLINQDKQASINTSSKLKQSFKAVNAYRDTSNHSDKK